MGLPSRLLCPRGVDMQRRQPLIIFLLIGMAIILALGLFLVVLFIQNRPEVPEGTELQIVEGVEVRVNPDPAKEVVMVQPVNVEQPVTDPQPQPAAPAPQEVTPVPPAPPTETPAPQVAAQPAPPANSVIFIDYVVQPGDTLYSIARRKDTSIALMAQHSISAEDLVPGQVIKLPIGNPAYCAPRQPYAVAEGDTAFSIARRHGISADELRAINNLDANYTVYAATIICVP